GIDLAALSCQLLPLALYHLACGTFGLFTGEGCLKLFSANLEALVELFESDLDGFPLCLQVAHVRLSAGCRALQFGANDRGQLISGLAGSGCGHGRTVRLNAPSQGKAQTFHRVITDTPQGLRERRCAAFGWRGNRSGCLGVNRRKRARLEGVRDISADTVQTTAEHGA